MKSEYQNYRYSFVDKEELINASKIDFSTLKKSVSRLDCILCNINCDNDVLKELMQNQSTPFDKLEADILDGIARWEITVMPLLLLAIKRFKNNKDFMLGVKHNANYPQFIEIQKKAIDNFEKTVALHIQELETASTVAIIESIKDNKTLLEKERDELIQQYPDIEGQLSSIISEFDVAVTAAQIRVTSVQSSSSSAPSFTPMFNRDSTNNQMNHQASSALSQPTRDPNIIDSEMLMNIFNSVPY